MRLPTSGCRASLTTLRRGWRCCVGCMRFQQRRIEAIFPSGELRRRSWGGSCGGATEPRVRPATRQSVVAGAERIAAEGPPPKLGRWHLVTPVIPALPA